MRHTPYAAQVLFPLLEGNGITPTGLMLPQDPEPELRPQGREVETFGDEAKRDDVQGRGNRQMSFSISWNEWNMSNM